MFEYQSLVSVLEERSRLKDKGITFINGEKEEDFLSYNELYESAEGILYNLQMKGIKPGNELIFQIEDNKAFVCTFWACILGGIIPVPVTVGNNDEHRLKLIKIFNILNSPYLLTSRKLLCNIEKLANNKEVGESYEKMLKNSLFIDDIMQIDSKGLIYDTKIDDIAFIQFSSGSTGDPKGVILTHENLLWDTVSLNKRIETKESDISLSWMPLTHDMGLIAVHIASLVAGINQFLIPTSLFVKRPTLWISKTHEHSASLLYSPNFGYKHFLNFYDKDLEKDWDLSCVRYIINGAEPISSKLCDEFLEAMSHYKMDRSVMHPGYGLAEGTVAVAIQYPNDKFSIVNLHREFLGIGQNIKYVEADDINCVSFVEEASPLEGCEIRICDENNNILEENQIGLIQIKGKNVSKGYYKNPQATRKAISQDGWLNTGDMGFIKDGRIIVTGRFKDIIFANGMNLYPHDIERVAETVDGVDLGKVAACGVFNEGLGSEEIILFILFKKKVSDFLQFAIEIKRSISKNMGIDIAAVLPIKRIPKTTSGKIQRYALAEAYKKGEFDSVRNEINLLQKEYHQYCSNKASGNSGKDSDSKIGNKLLEIWREVFKKEDIKISDSVNLYSLSSISVMSIIAKISNQLNAEISFQEFIEQNSILDIAVLIEEKLRCKSDKLYDYCEPDIKNMYETFPLSEVQMAYFTGRDEKFELGGISTHFYIEMDSKIDIYRFNNCLSKVIKRHPMLRSIILPNGEQKILESVPEYKIDIIETVGMDNETRDEQIYKIKERMSHHIFKTDNWPLFEFKAIKMEENLFKLCIGFDMLIVDGGSFQIIGRELSELYNNSELVLPEIDFTFRDYILAHRKFKDTQKYLDDKKFWMDKLYDFPASPALPLKSEPSKIGKPQFNRKSYTISKNEWEKLKNAAIIKNIRPSSLLCSAYAKVLSHWSNQQRFCINMTLFNRYPFHPDVEKIVGDFTSVMLLDTEVKSGVSIWDDSLGIQEKILESLAHKHFDGVEFVREYVKYNNLGSKIAMPVVFTSMLFDENYGGWNEFGNITMGISQTSQVYLDNQVLETGGDLSISWDYVSDLFEDKMIEAMFSQYISLLLSIIETGDSEDLSISKEDNEIIEQYNKTEENIKPATLQKLFIEQAGRTPENVAVKLGQQTVTFKELDEKSNQIACYLCEKNIGRNNLVGVYAKRDVNTIINIMGILKAGAAYVPVDPEYPEERRQYILSNSGCKLLMGPEFYTENGISKYSENYQGVYDNLDDIAYVIYTSGSTGRPKGVVITHRAVSNTIIDINRKFNVTEKDRIIGLSSMCFDLSVYDIFGALSTGAALVMVPDQRDVMNLIDTVVREEITFWNSVPAIMDMMLSNAEDDFMSRHLRAVLLSGDWIPLKLPEKIMKHFENAKVTSLGGATEASIWSIYYPVKEVKEEWKSIPYGMPLANQKFYVLDYKMELCPVGVQGELYIGGIGVAKEYMNDREKTKNSFISHPKLGFIYKTGDYGVLHKEGYIEFLGRKDFQVKIRGYRIELGEIESRLMDHPDVINAVVIDQNDSMNKKYLCAYLVTDNMPKSEELRDYLLGALPEYMIPKYFVGIDEIPLTPNGKVDRKALPVVSEDVNAENDYVAPRNISEEKLAKIWEEVLGIDRVGVNDNFFNLGGDSIKAIQISAKAKQNGMELSLTDIYTHSTIANLLKEVDYGNKKIQVPQQEVIGEATLTPIQRWLFQQENKHLNYWNFTRIFRLSNNADLGMLEKVFQRLVEHHDALRTVFKIENGNVIQYIKPFSDTEFKLEVIDISAYSKTERKKLIKDYGEKIQDSFDLENGLLIKAVVFEMGEDGRRLLIPVHHLVMDGISWRIILEDIESLYKSQLNTDLPLKTTSFKEWAGKLQEYASSKQIDTKYWQGISNETGHIAEKENLFKDYKIYKIKFNEEQTNNILVKSNRAFNTDNNDILLSGLLMSSAEAMGRKDIMLTLEGHGREDIIEDVDISRTIGWFTCEYPVYFSAQPDIANTIKHVRSTLKDIPAKGINFGLGRYLKNDEKLKNLNPDIAFNYLGQYDHLASSQNTLLADSDEDFGPIIHPDNKYAHELYIYGMTKNGCLQLDIAYNANVYSVDVIQNFCEIYQKKLVDISAYCGAVEIDTGDIKESIYKKQAPDPANLHEPFNLTAVQMAYLMGRNPHFQLGGVSTHYYAEIETSQDIERFNRSLVKVIKRHPMLRTIVLPDGQQKILRDVPEYEIVTKDLRGLDEESKKANIEEIRNRMSHHIFKSDEWPLFEFKAFKIDDNRNYICMGFDLMIADGASFQIIGRELKEFYENEDLELEKLEFSFRDYILAYEDFKNSEIYLQDKEYWQKKLDGFPNAAAVPVKVDPSSIKNPCFKRKSKIISKEKWNEIKAISRKNNITPSALLCTAYAEVLAHWSNQPDMAINLTVFNRYPFHKEVGDIVGDFTSIILVDIHLEAEKTFWNNAKGIQMTLMEALDHRHYDGVEFIRDVTKHKGLENVAAMPIVFTSMLFDDNQTGLSELIRNMKYGISQTSQVYIDYQVMEIDGKLSITWDYVDGLFDEKVIDSMFNDYSNLLLNIKEDEITGLQVEPDDSKIIEQYNKTEENIEPATLQKLFIEQARRTPENVAVKLGQQTVTFKELDEKSNQIACYLCEKNIGRNNLVGVYAKRDVKTIINIMGILKAGAAYVPVDPEYPEERRQYILSNSGCKLLMGPEFYTENGIYEYSENYQGVYDNLDDIAYVIYTSGSTGRPKGVVITHRAVSNTIIDINRKFNVTEKDRIIGLSSMCFDLSVYDIFGALSTGAALVMVPDQRDVMNLIDTVVREKITFWNSVPAIMDMMLSNAEDDFMSGHLRAVLLSGDWIPLKLPEKIMKHFENAQVTSLGGATEASIWSIYYPIKEVKEEWKSIPYGMPLANQKFYVLDYKMELCPVGVQGELYIGGIGVAKEYMNDREKTKNSFISHPKLGFIYKTGDYGVLHKEGYIEFLGRKDFQVKIRGYRIELGEIESRLMDHPDVINAVVIDRNDPNGKKYLCGYVVSNKTLEPEELRSFLSKDLPDYMIPTQFVQLEKIPLTQNGKISIKDLPEPSIQEDNSADSADPRNEIEQIMVQVWKEVLGLPKVKISESFFALGGDSIKAIQICAQLQKHGLKLEVQNIFYQQTIEKISGQVKVETNKFSQEIVTGEALPAPIQKWFFEQNLTNMHHWNQAFSLFRKDGFDEAVLRKVFDKILLHHDALRSRFTKKDGEFIQSFKGIEENLYTLEVFNALNDDNFMRATTEALERLHRGIDLENGPLVKLGLFKKPEGDYLVVIIHHLVVDGISWRILFEDIAEGYKQVLRNEDIKLQEKTYSFKNWSDELYKFADSIRMLNEVEFWRELTSESILELPKKTLAFENKINNCDVVSVTLDAADTDKLLKNVHQAYNTEINEILLAALGMALNKWTGFDRFFINLEGHGRENIIQGFDHSRIMGWFTSIYPVLIKNAESKDTGLWIKAVKDMLRRIPNKGVGYGILKYISSPENTRGINFAIKPEISFNYLGQMDHEKLKEVFEISTELTGQCMSPDSERTCLIDIVGIISNDELEFRFIYNHDAFDETAISGLVKAFKEGLLQIIDHCEARDTAETTVSDFEFKDLSDEDFEDILSIIED